MIGYIIKYENDLVCVTNNINKWLEKNNKQRLADGNEIEKLIHFNIEAVELNIYEKVEVRKWYQQLEEQLKKDNS